MLAANLSLQDFAPKIQRVSFCTRRKTTTTNARPMCEGERLELATSAVTDGGKTR
jgi:hypothetical protein